jgi:hypothetical protein
MCSKRLFLFSLCFALSTMPPRRKKTTEEQYDPYLHKFMVWKDGTNYPAWTVFTQEQLLAIRARHLVQYMSLLAYQTEKPGEGDHPTEARSTGLEFVKKAISSFMPNRNVQWNMESQTGNPTMSVAINDLIKKIKKGEVCKLGKKSNAKRDMKRADFRKYLRLLEVERGNFVANALFGVGASFRP